MHWNFILNGSNLWLLLWYVIYLQWAKNVQTIIAKEKIYVKHFEWLELTWFIFCYMQNQVIATIEDIIVFEYPFVGTALFFPTNPCLEKWRKGVARMKFCSVALLSTKVETVPLKWKYTIDIISLRDIASQWGRFIGLLLLIFLIVGYCILWMNVIVRHLICLHNHLEIKRCPGVKI